MPLYCIQEKINNNKKEKQSIDNIVKVKNDEYVTYILRVNLMRATHFKNRWEFDIVDFAETVIKLLGQSLKSQCGETTCQYSMLYGCNNVHSLRWTCLLHLYWHINYLLCSSLLSLTSLHSLCTLSLSFCCLHLSSFYFLPQPPLLSSLRVRFSLSPSPSPTLSVRLSRGPWAVHYLGVCSGHSFGRGATLGLVLSPSLSLAYLFSGLLK